jgi:hypothetical protein
MDRNPSHAAIALGCHLYQYRSGHISALAPDLFDEANIRHVNSKLLDMITQRFPHLPIERKSPYGEKKVRTRMPTSAERTLIQDSLKMFTSWWVSHIPAEEKDSLLTQLFSTKYHAP